MKETVERFLMSQIGAELPVWAKAMVALTNVILILMLSWMLMRLSGRLLRALNAHMARSQSSEEERKRKAEEAQREYDDLVQYAKDFVAKDPRVVANVFKGWMSTDGKAAG